MEDNPDRCKVKNRRSIDEDPMRNRGTQKVQPQLTPLSTVTAIAMMKRDDKNNQIDPAFNRGKIRSDDPNIIGNKILPNPPINIGMIMKKIMNRP